ncbi:hypothetical protein HCA69_16295 [Listeria grandensis]|uniref:Uncharacterized protein n=1 Tax=Listeria grandensis TaxID=1494963 RepID=A0A7X0Y709_9LIST|nr:hypothetical protein [Listeria grandensis]MBC1937923.1 hypothetical protein [Listeria grandensis]
MQMIQIQEVPKTKNWILNRSKTRTKKWVLVNTVIGIRGIDFVEPIAHQDLLRKEVHAMPYGALLQECKTYFKETHNVVY